MAVYDDEPRRQPHIPIWSTDRPQVSAEEQNLVLAVRADHPDWTSRHIAEHLAGQVTYGQVCAVFAQQ